MVGDVYLDTLRRIFCNDQLNSFVVLVVYEKICGTLLIQGFCVDGSHQVEASPYLFCAQGFNKDLVVRLV